MTIRLKFKFSTHLVMYKHSLKVQYQPGLTGLKRVLLTHLLYWMKL